MKAKKILFFLIILLTFVPFCQYLLHFSKEKGRKGYYVKKEKPEISAESLFSSDYQSNYEQYYNENFGFRPYFVCLRNQIYYSLFGVFITKDANVVIGRNKYLYESDYITNGVLGKDFSGYDSIRDKARKIKFIQTKLQSEGKQLLIVFAPGKGSYFKQYIPKEFLKEKPSVTNYTAYKQVFDSIGVNYIDFKQWFFDLKRDNPAELFTKNGVHWNKYGTFLAMDSLVKYFNKQYAFMPDLILEENPFNDEIWYNEDDCYQSFNLLFPPKKEKYFHPKFHFQNKTAEKRLKLLETGDSYFWNFFVSGFAKDYFQDGEYWYYNDVIYYARTGEEKPCNEADIAQSIESSDVIMLLNTDATLGKYDRGFINQVYDYLVSKK